ncbi:MAG: UDP-N-acetylmuramoyl-L-alanyl-D-glutamate--2,6-diaminopimelate ligase [Candidatus Doudnabacteria bacterium]|nr:UDP-N-acetylmuramoyl-L-alanyl-D-glutamate--2,6-diaminopimelate ligase [Candidatus Doudnabacteria bacterium]
MLRKVKNLGHLGLAVFANVLYGFPSRKLKVIGVTGTDGKTTTASLIYHILKSAGKKSALITTVGAYIDGQMSTVGFHVTTPSPFTIQRFLRNAVNLGHEFAVLETSSHGIDQNRIWGIHFMVAVITNITHEHLDYHPSFDRYINTKFKLLNSSDTAVVNIDDENIRSRINLLQNKVVTYSKLQTADFNLDSYPFKSRLFGTFNQANTLAAIAVCKELGISDEQIRTGVSSFKAPEGRQEIVYDKEYKIMVDFAHTPNSVENILKGVKATNPKRLIHVYGAPGKRDESKRPLMGAASSKYADIMIITADDPRHEKVLDIISQIKMGVEDKFVRSKNLFEIEDRRSAIEKAINMAQPGDFIVLTGKGHERTLAVGNKEIAWIEKNIVLDILDKKNKA